MAHPAGTQKRKHDLTTRPSGYTISGVQSYTYPSPRDVNELEKLSKLDQELNAALRDVVGFKDGDEGQATVEDIKLTLEHSIAIGRKEMARLIKRRNVFIDGEYAWNPQNNYYERTTNLETGDVVFIYKELGRFSFYLGTKDVLVAYTDDTELEFLPELLRGKRMRPKYASFPVHLNFPANEFRFTEELGQKTINIRAWDGHKFDVNWDGNAWECLECKVGVSVIDQKFNTDSDVCSYCGAKWKAEMLSESEDESEDEHRVPREDGMSEDGMDEDEVAAHKQFEEDHYRAFSKPPEARLAPTPKPPWSNDANMQRAVQEEEERALHKQIGEWENAQFQIKGREPSQTEIKAKRAEFKLAKLGVPSSYWYCWDCYRFDKLQIRNAQAQHSCIRCGVPFRLGHETFSRKQEEKAWAGDFRAFGWEWADETHTAIKGAEKQTAPARGGGPAAKK
jgi:hypothetical protein